ncbi:MAG: hypothetical protein ACE5GA_09925 [Candidatus Zixiibacteriota bacterium]
MSRLSNWPGRGAAHITARVPAGWIPTGFGPGEGPDLSVAPAAQGRLSVTDLYIRSEALFRSETRALSPSSEIAQADHVLRNRPGKLCPSCGYASLKLDADLHVSCPICNFGVHH